MKMKPASMLVIGVTLLAVAPGCHAPTVTLTCTCEVGRPFTFDLATA